jgi:hypothetical protein
VTWINPEENSKVKKIYLHVKVMLMSHESDIYSKMSQNNSGYYLIAERILFYIQI